MNDVSNDKPAGPARLAAPPQPAAGHRAGRRRRAFFGPWKTNHVWAQTARKKPLVIGLTMDASGQYGASGAMERLGAMLAIHEFNAKGGVLGRKIEAIHMRHRDRRRPPARASPSA